MRIHVLTGAIIILAVATSASASDKGDPKRGKRDFIQCAGCHSVEPGRSSRLGPTLAGVYDSKAASRPDYVYSDALMRSELVWNHKALDQWLEGPSKMVPGTKMAGAGISKPRVRKDLIAYLKTLR
jgi:cytochrome c